MRQRRPLYIVTRFRYGAVRSCPLILRDKTRSNSDGKCPHRGKLKRLLDRGGRFPLAIEPVTFCSLVQSSTN